MKTTKLYGVYSPITKNVVYTTLDTNRSRAIKKSGCPNYKEWTKLKKLGFKIIQTQLTYR